MIAVDGFTVFVAMPSALRSELPAGTAAVATTTTTVTTTTTTKTYSYTRTAAKNDPGSLQSSCVVQ